jgi:hypothetical protein
LRVVPSVAIVIQPSHCAEKPSQPQPESPPPMPKPRRSLAVPNMLVAKAMVGSSFDPAIVRVERQSSSRIPRRLVAT